MSENLPSELKEYFESYEFRDDAFEFVMDKVDKMKAISDELKKTFPKGRSKGYRYSLKWSP